MDIDDEEYVVRNADTNEVLTLGQAAEKFTVMTVNDYPSKYEQNAFKHGEDEEDEYYFDAKQVSLSLGQEKSEVMYAPPSIPEGGRLQFARITAGI